MITLTMNCSRLALLLFLILLGGCDDRQARYRPLDQYLAQWSEWEVAVEPALPGPYYRPGYGIAVGTSEPLSGSFTTDVGHLKASHPAEQGAELQALYLETVDKRPTVVILRYPAWKDSYLTNAIGDVRGGQ